MGEGGRGVSKSSKRNMTVTFFITLVNIGGEGGGAVQEVCVGECIKLSIVCGGGSVVRVGLLGQWWRRGSAESEGD